jgi:hypothetical protein
MPPEAMIARLPSTSAATARSSSAACTSGEMEVLERSSSSPAPRWENFAKRCGSAAKSGRIAPPPGAAAKRSTRAQAVSNVESLMPDPSRPIHLE